MTTDRSFRSHMPMEEALRILETDPWKQWDPVITQKFVRLIQAQYILS